MMARVGGGRVKTFSIGFAAKEYDETALCPHGGAALRHRPPGVHRRTRRGRGAAAAGVALRRAVRRSVGDPDLLRRRAGAPHGHGGAHRRWRRRVLSRLRPLPGDALARPPRPAAALEPRGARTPPRPAPRPGCSGASRRSGSRARCLAPRSQPAARYAPTIAFFADGDKEEGYGEAMRGLGISSALDLLAPHFSAAPKPRRRGQSRRYRTPICPTI